MQWIYIASIFGALLSGVYVGSSLNQAKWDAVKVAQAEGEKAALDSAARAIAQIEVVQQTIIQKVRHEVTEKQIYRECVVPADGIRLLNAAARGESAPSD